jgi:hypothetical protein
MSASEAQLYKALGTFSLAGQSSPLTITDADVKAGGEVLISLKTEAGTLSGVSVQNITDGSFQVVFNVANDSVYVYYAVPPTYRYSSTA